MGCGQRSKGPGEPANRERGLQLQNPLTENAERCVHRPCVLETISKLHDEDPAASFGIISDASIECDHRKCFFLEMGQGGGGPALYPCMTWGHWAILSKDLALLVTLRSRWIAQASVGPGQQLFFRDGGCG